MIPSQALFERAFVLLGEDTTTLDKTGGTENVVILIKEPFTPAGNLDPTTLDEATFTGYAARTIDPNSIPQSNDPATGDSLLTFTPAATPFLWETTNTANLPQTIYGYLVTNPGKTVMYGAELLPSPVLLTAANQSIQLPGYPQFRMLAGSVV